MIEPEATAKEPNVTISVRMSMLCGAYEWRARVWLGYKLVMLAARVLVRGIGRGFGDLSYEESDDRA